MHNHQSRTGFSAGIALLIAITTALSGCSRAPAECNDAFGDEASLDICAEACLTGNEAACPTAIEAIRATVAVDPQPALLMVGCQMGAEDLCELNAQRQGAVRRMEREADRAAEAPTEPQRTQMVPPVDQAAIDQNVAAVAADLRAQTPTPSAADSDSAPRSEVPGEPGVASSCNLIRTLRECYEQAPSLGEQGFYSTETACGTTGIFSTDACPTAYRVGTCILGDGQQVAHFYADHVGLQEQCVTQYAGRWAPAPSARTFPINAR